MGFESKIIVKFTPNQIVTLKEILMRNTFFDKTYLFRNECYLDFRHPENTGEMPCLTIGFDNDGLYVLENASLNLWKDIIELEEYLEENMIIYKKINLTE